MAAFKTALVGIMLLVASTSVGVATPASASQSTTADTFTDAETCTLVERSFSSSVACDDDIEAQMIGSRTHAATVFTNKEFGGRRLRIYKLGGDCSPELSDDEWRAYFPSGNWAPFQDNIESIYTFNHCDIRLMDGEIGGYYSQSKYIHWSNNLNVTQVYDWNNIANFFTLS